MVSHLAEKYSVKCQETSCGKNARQTIKNHEAERLENRRSWRLANKIAVHWRPVGSTIREVEHDAQDQ